MIERLLLIVGIVAAAAVLAWLLERRRSARVRPVAGAAAVPSQLDRDDFERPDAPWLVLLFSSDACESCAAMADRIAPLASDTVAVDESEFGSQRPIHEKYRIESVPAIGVYDIDGVARASFLGTTDSLTLWSAVEDLQQR